MTPRRLTKKEDDSEAESRVLQPIGNVRRPRYRDFLNGTFNKPLDDVIFKYARDKEQANRQRINIRTFYRYVGMRRRILGLPEETKPKPKRKSLQNREQ